MTSKKSKCFAVPVVIILSAVGMAGLSWAQHSPESPTSTGAPARANLQLENDPIVLRVGTRVVTASEFNRLMSVVPPDQQRQYQGPGGRQAFANYLIQLLALSQAAEKEKLDHNPMVTSQMELGRLQLLAFAEQKAILDRATVTEDQIQKFYNTNQSRFVELHLLHISVPFSKEGSSQESEHTRQTMQQLHDRAVAGADFGRLAQEYSKDSDAALGGDLGFMGRGKLGEAVDNVIFQLQPGQVSPIVETPGSMHIFKAIGRRPQPLTGAREAIVEILKNQMLQMSVPSLVTEMKPALNLDFFKAPALEIPAGVKILKDGRVVKEEQTTVQGTGFKK
ncbi:MAG: peptidylprolyl isomerase [Acidobacteriia bacterium]|nr:peptidylprolyl isomerase [Terriglobia bacterium]